MFLANLCKKYIESIISALNISSYGDVMAKGKKEPRYRGFSLAVPLIEEINKQIKDDEEYRSTADFVREAVREKLDGMIISGELTSFEQLIYRDLMRQKRLEALKESTSFLERERALKESINENKT